MPLILLRYSVNSAEPRKGHELFFSIARQRDIIARERDIIARQREKIARDK